MLNIRKQEPTPPLPARPEPSNPSKSVYERFPSPRETAMTTAMPTTTPQSVPADEGPTDFVIGRGTRLKGEIEAGGDVIVEGEVEASIHAATMRIARGGSVQGEVHAANAEVRGRFEGTLQVRECLTVAGEGHVSGTIRYGELNVEKGGRITGDIALVEEKPRAKAETRNETEPQGSAA